MNNIIGVVLIIFFSSITNIFLMKLTISFLTELIKRSDERTDELFTLYSKLNRLKPFPKEKDDKH